MGVLESLQSLYRKINIKIGLHYRLIIAIILVIYIITIIYLENEESQEDLEEYLEIFKHDKQFFEKLYQMNPESREKYIKVIKKILDSPSTNAKKVKTLNKIKNGAIFAGMTEFLLGSSGGIGSFLTSTTKNAFAIGLTGAFT